MPTSTELSSTQLREALQLSEQIDTLQQRLKSLLGGSGGSVASAAPAKTKSTRGGKTGKRTMSAEARARIGAAAKARWAKARGETTSAPVAAKTAPAKKKGGLTAEGRARLAAAMKARWAARKKGAPAPNAAKD